MGIPVLRGRTVGGTGEGGEAVAVINRTAAKQLWQDADPVGRSLRRDGIVYRVLGVAADARSRTIGETQRPCVYFSFAGNHGRDATPFGLVLLVRTSGDPAPMAGVIRREIREAEPRLAVSNVRTMERQLANALVIPRAGAIAFGAFGLTGIILTAVGLYGVVAFSASRRTREFGVRSALGARRANIVRLVLAAALVPAVTGVAIGTGAAYASTRVLSKLLYGVSSTDPLTFALVPAAVLLLTLAAAYIPARRAASLIHSKPFGSNKVRSGVHWRRLLYSIRQAGRSLCAPPSKAGPVLSCYGTETR